MTNQRRIWNLIVLLLAIAAISIVLLVGKDKGGKKLPVYSTLSDQESLMSLPFRNQVGEDVNMHRYEGRVMVVDFIFTHCPTICPVMTENMTDVQKAYADEDRLQILSFSVDPERDSVQRMAFFADRFDADPERWHFLTGEKKDIYEIARKGFTVTATEGDGGPHDFIHSPIFVLLDRKTQIRGFYDGTDTTEVRELIADIDRLL